MDNEQPGSGSLQLHSLCSAQSSIYYLWQISSQVISVHPCMGRVKLMSTGSSTCTEAELCARVRLGSYFLNMKPDPCTEFESVYPQTG